MPVTLLTSIGGSSLLDRHFYLQKIMKTPIKIALGIALILALLGGIIFGIVTITRGEPTFPSDNENCDTANVPYDLFIRENDRSYLISWNEPWPNSVCDVIYLLQYSVDDGQKIQINVTTNYYTISNLNLPSCSILQLRLWGISRIGAITEDSITGTYREIPRDVYDSDLNFTNVDEGLLVTWHKPIELIRCLLNYTLLISTDSSRFDINSNTESVIIPHIAYCFQVIVTIRVRVEDQLITSLIDVHFEEGYFGKVQVSISPDNPRELIVTWDNHPKQEQCSVEYYVEFSTSGSEVEDGQSANVTSPQARFNFEYCSISVVRIVIYGHDGTMEGPSIAVGATQYPEFTFNISVTSQETTEVITWRETPYLETCNITYLVNITSEIGDYTYRTEDSSIEFPVALHCFQLTVQIRTHIWEQIGKPTIAEFQFDLDPVDELELVVEASSDSLSAKWESHAKQELCGIEYLVTFGDGIDNQTTTTKESSISFDIPYCTTAFVIVETVSGSAISEGSFASYDTGSPVWIGKVQNIMVENAWDGYLMVTWDSPAYVTQCDIEYTVTAAHPVAGSNTCSGYSGCDIYLSDFCPSTSLEIVVTSLDGEPILGEPVTETYNC